MFLKPALTIAYHENRNFIISYMHENENFNEGNLHVFRNFELKQRVNYIVKV